MSFSSKISRRGISPLDVDLSKAVFNIKRKVMFNVDRLSQSSGVNSAATVPPTSMAFSHKNATSVVADASSRPLPSPIEILFNPFAHENNLASQSANVTEVSSDWVDASVKDDPFTLLVNKVTEGLRCYPPELCDEGENGTYFLKDKFGKRIAVFKCADEEGTSSPKRKANPPVYPDDQQEDQFYLEMAGEREQPSASLQQKLTDCVKNEVAAYILDLQSHGFYSVPQTGLIAIHPFHGKAKNTKYFTTTKVGSLQQFVESDGTAADVGPVLFPVREVHKIGILDLQILNLDRHLGNILIKKDEPESPFPPAPISRGDSPFRSSRTLSGVPLSSNGQGPVSSGTSLPSSWPRLPGGEFSLTPIDHGYSLPLSLSDVKDLWFEWITFPQAKRPFDDETKQFIESIDVNANARALRELGICEESIKLMKLTTSLLKKCAAASWNLYQIAMLLVNVSLQDDDEPSALEDLMAEVEEDYQALSCNNGDHVAADEALYLTLISQKIDDLLQQHEQMLLKQQSL